jgi:hypothetical protein
MASIFAFLSKPAQSDSVQGWMISLMLCEFEMAFRAQVSADYCDAEIVLVVISITRAQVAPVSV